MRVHCDYVRTNKNRLVRLPESVSVSVSGSADLGCISRYPRALYIQVLLETEF